MIKYNIGDKHGRLTIVAPAPSSDKYPKKRMVLCQCDCGKEISYPICYLVNGIVTSCGCKNNSPRLDLRGKRFGKVVFLEPTGEIQNHSAVWKCRCDCGNTFLSTANSLLYGGRTGCGCTKKETQLKNAVEARKNQCVADSTNLSTISRDKPISSNTSGYVGVTFHKGTGKWAARISIRGKAHHLGYFDNIEEAHKARLNAEELYFRPVLEAYSEEYPELLERYLNKK